MASSLVDLVVDTNQGARSRKKRVLDSAEESGSNAAKKGCFLHKESAREQARQYRVLTARMPTKALTTTWSIGESRRLNMQHVRTLTTLFTQGGLNRKAEENHLLVLCYRADIMRMIEHLERQDEGTTANSPDELPLFKEWLLVNRGNPAEIMDGQHRVKALETYVRETGAAEDELWWTCEFYDKGELQKPLDYCSGEQ